MCRYFVDRVPYVKTPAQAADNKDVSASAVASLLHVPDASAAECTPPTAPAIALIAQARKAPTHFETYAQHFSGSQHGCGRLNSCCDKRQGRRLSPRPRAHLTSLCSIPERVHNMARAQLDLRRHMASRFTGPRRFEGGRVNKPASGCMNNSARRRLVRSDIVGGGVNENIVAWLSFPAHGVKLSDSPAIFLRLWSFALSATFSFRLPHDAVP